MSARTVLAPGALLLALGLVLVACGGGADDDAPGVRPSKDASASESACPAKDRCYDFSDDAEGWPVVNDAQHFAGRDPYLHGSYRIGARESGSWSLSAPVRVSELADDYGVRIETDATLGHEFPATAAWGATCWTRDLGQGRVAGFAVYVQPDLMTLGIYDEGTGVFRPLARHAVDSASTPGDKSHLTLRCAQSTSSGGVKASIQAELQDGPTLAVSYARSVKNYAWSPADGVGLLAAGKGADVFYDHVVISPA
jgi:hypothetical protein